MKSDRPVPDWEKLLAHAARLQTHVPGAVLVGGTAAAFHAGHRLSVDHDHVIRDLAGNYDETFAALSSIAGWRTRRRIRGKLVLGEAEGIDAGVRNQRRNAPLETVDVDLGKGRRLKLPTVEEMLRVKAFLTVERNATRDFLDVAALSHHLGRRQSSAALESMNDLYGEFAGDSGDILTSVITALAKPRPYDLTEVDLSEYKGIIAPWNDWNAVEEQCSSLAAAVLDGQR